MIRGRRLLAAAESVWLKISRNEQGLYRLWPIQFGFQNRCLEVASNDTDVLIYASLETSTWLR